MRAALANRTTLDADTQDPTDNSEPEVRPWPGVPRYMSEVNWHALTGLSRATTYRALGRKELHSIKIGRSMLIDAWRGLSWLESLPAAKIAAPKVRVAA